jgi:hypothetical protein
MAISPAQSALPSPLPQKRALELLEPRRVPASTTALRLAFWSVGVLLASLQAWIFRYEVSADSISYFDMSDGLLGSGWHRLINGVYSILYPFLLGVFRRLFHISPGEEIPAAHAFGVVLFIFAFACFEFFLVSAMSRLGTVKLGSREARTAALPRWAFLSVAYSVFLWACIAHITLEIPRADMLMSGFLYLAAGLLFRMQGRAPRWSSFLVLGVVLGLGILAKAAMLPMGLLVLGLTFFVANRWRPVLKLAPITLVVMFLIASVYFVPLSLQKGRFTLGEASRFVYIVNVDGASPHWYLQRPGSAIGTFSHPPTKIFSDPPAYAFPIQAAVTHPLRFDPSIWVDGVRPHFAWRRELTALKSSTFIFIKLLRELGIVLGAIFVLAFLADSKQQILAALARGWPAWVIGLAGCSMYAAIYVEPRYVVAFLTLVCVGMLVGIPVPEVARRKVAQLFAVATILALSFPVAAHFRDASGRRTNVAFEAAQALNSIGVRAGDAVARISPSVADFDVERVCRLKVVAEVDHDHIADFWNSSFATRQSLLRTLASQGAKVVIATSPVLNAENRSEWSRLGTTPYWVWRPVSR